MAANATVFQNSTRGKLGGFELQTQVGFPIYGITIMTFVGCFMVCFYLPTGMWAYVFDYIGAWQQRPKPMNEVDFNRQKAELAKKVQQLL